MTIKIQRISEYVDDRKVNIPDGARNHQKMCISELKKEHNKLMEKSAGTLTKKEIHESINKGFIPKGFNAIIHLIPTKELRTIYLNDTHTSWIKLFELEPPNGLTMNDVEQVWSLKPTEKHQIKIAGKLINCPRFSKSYLKPYNFSGLNHEADLTMPERVRSLMNNYAKTVNFRLNQSLINWYEFVGSIGKHSDDTRQLQTDSDIFSLRSAQPKEILF